MRKYIAAFVLSLAISTVLLTQIKITVTKDAPDLGSFLFINKDNESRSQVKVLEKPQYVGLQLDPIVLDDGKWKLQVYVSAITRMFHNTNVTYYKEGKPLPVRKEARVGGWLPQFDIDYLDKITKERTHTRKYLVSEFVDGLDNTDYLLDAKKNEQGFAPVSTYSIGRITIVNRQTTVTDRRFEYNPDGDLYYEKVDVEMLFDIKCMAQGSFRISLMDNVNEITGGTYNTLSLTMGALTLGILLIRSFRNLAEKEP